MIQYGLTWPDDLSPLDIEFEMIRMATEDPATFAECGRGLFHHYR